MFIADAVAQVATMPPPPGASPFIEWLWTIFGGVVSASILGLSVWIRAWVASQQERAAIANQKARSEMIAASVENAAHTAVGRMVASGQDISMVTWPLSPILQEAVSYVCVSRPEAIAATDQADEEHLAKFILAAMHGILNQQHPVQPPVALPASFTAARIMPVEATVIPANSPR